MSAGAQETEVALGARPRPASAWPPGWRRRRTPWPAAAPADLASVSAALVVGQLDRRGRGRPAGRLAAPRDPGPAPARARNPGAAGGPARSALPTTDSVRSRLALHPVEHAAPADQPGRRGHAGRVAGAGKDPIEHQPRVVDRRARPVAAGEAQVDPAGGRRGNAHPQLQRTEPGGAEHLRPSPDPATALTPAGRRSAAIRCTRGPGVRRRAARCPPAPAPGRERAQRLQDGRGQRVGGAGGRPEIRQRMAVGGVEHDEPGAGIDPGAAPRARRGGHRLQPGQPDQRARRRRAGSSGGAGAGGSHATSGGDVRVRKASVSTVACSSACKLRPSRMNAAFSCCRVQLSVGKRITPEGVAEPLLHQTVGHLVATRPATSPDRLGPVEVRAQQPARGVDRLALVVRAPDAVAVVVLQAQADRIEQLVADAAGRGCSLCSSSARAWWRPGAAPSAARHRRWPGVRADRCTAPRARTGCPGPPARSARRWPALASRAG